MNFVLTIIFKFFQCMAVLKWLVLRSQVFGHDKGLRIFSYDCMVCDSKGVHEPYFINSGHVSFHFSPTNIAAIKIYGETSLPMSIHGCAHICLPGSNPVSGIALDKES